MFINSVTTSFANKIIRPLFLSVLKLQPFTSRTLAFVFYRFLVDRFVVFDCSLFCSSAVRFVEFDRGLFGFYSSALRPFASAFSLFSSSTVRSSVLRSFTSAFSQFSSSAVCLDFSLFGSSTVC